MPSPSAPVQSSPLPQFQAFLAKIIQLWTSSIFLPQLLIVRTGSMEGKFRSTEMNLDQSFIFFRFYSDEEAFCQMYHMCVSEPSWSYMKFSFLCPNGTMFNQENLVCDAWVNVDCSTETIEVKLTERLRLKLYLFLERSSIFGSSGCWKDLYHPWLGLRWSKGRFPLEV